MSTLKLYLILLGCRPSGRTIEQHDIFMGIGEDIRSLIPDMKRHWPEAKGNIHIDAWQQVQYANGYEIMVQDRAGEKEAINNVCLFFINLGGYKPGEFEEYHYKMVVAAKDKAEAIKLAKATAFFRHTGFKGGEAHIDDKYGIDVDDAYAIADILSVHFKEKYCITLSPLDSSQPLRENELHVGYFRLDGM
jgi:hypothetical protein